MKDDSSIPQQEERHNKDNVNLREVGQQEQNKGGKEKKPKTRPENHTSSRKGKVTKSKITPNEERKQVHKNFNLNPSPKSEKNRQSPAVSPSFPLQHWKTFTPYFQTNEYPRISKYPYFVQSTTTNNTDVVDENEIKFLHERIQGKNLDMNGNGNVSKQNPETVKYENVTNQNMQSLSSAASSSLSLSSSSLSLSSSSSS